MRPKQNGSRDRGSHWLMPQFRSRQPHTRTTFFPTLRLSCAVAYFPRMGCLS